MKNLRYSLISFVIALFGIYQGYAQITIPNVPTNTKKPGVYIDYNITLANQGLAQNPQTLLILGNMDTSGSATLGTLYQCFNTYAGNTLFGTTSNLASMIGAALNANPYVVPYVMAYDVNTNQVTNALSTTRLVTALNNVFAQQFSFIALDCNSTVMITLLRNEIDTAGNAVEQRGQVGVFAFCTTQGAFGTQAVINSATTAAAAMNDGRMISVCYPNPYELDYNLAASYAATLASNGDPALPYNGVILQGVPASPVQYMLSRAQQETLMNEGCCPIQVGAGLNSEIVRAITTFMSQNGLPSIALLDVNTILTLDYTRTALRTRLQQQFPRAKMTPQVIGQVRTAIITILQLEEQLQILENVEADLPQLVLQQDIQDPTRLDASIPANVVPGLDIIAAQLQLYL